MAKGDLTAKLVVNSTDEIGRMATAMNATVAAIKASLDKTQAAREQANQASEQAKAATAQAKEGAERERVAAAELQRKVDQMLEVVSAAARGDLTKEVTVKGTDAIGQMGEGLAGFLAQLRSTVGAIGQNGNTSKAAAELSRMSGALQKLVGQFKV